MAVINDWESSKSFDNELSKIEHYSKKHHKEKLKNSSILVDQLLDKANKYIYNNNESTARLDAILDLLKAENVELEVFRK